MTSLGLFMLFLAQPADAVPLVVLPPRAVGLDAASSEAAGRRIAEQVQALGLAVEQRPKGPAEGCLDDDACRLTLVTAKAGLIDVELLRFGPDVTVTARLYDEKGALRATSEQSMSYEAFAASRSLLGEDVTPTLKAMAAERATASPPDKLPEELPSTSPPAAPAASVESDESEGPSWLGLSLTGGAAAVGLGGLLVAGGGVGGYLLAQQVLGDATTTTAQKDQMIVVRYVGAGLFAAGLFAVAAGGAGAGVSTLLW